jgi:DNA-binding response OmpR family regulator
MYKRKIDFLLVEDNPLQQLAVEELILLSGFSCEVADNAEDALTLLRVNTFSYAIIDKNLPDMDGLQLWAKIKSQAPETIAFILSADEKPEKREVEAIPWLVKPLKTENITAITKKNTALSWEKYLSMEEVINH